MQTGAFISDSNYDILLLFSDSIGSLNYFYKQINE